MNQLLKWLAGGTLQSDGLAPKVAELVIQQPAILGDLLEGLEASDPVVRARTADAAERVARLYPERFIGEVPRLAALAESDPIPMVRWHIAMLLTDLVIFDEAVEPAQSCLHHLLQDSSAFVKSWAISGLCIIGRKRPGQRERILGWLKGPCNDASIAVRHRAQKAIQLLLDDRRHMPESWVKNKRLS